LLYATFYLGLGFFFGREIARALRFLTHYTSGVIAVILLLVIVFAGWKYAHRRRGTLAPTPTPLVGDLISTLRK
jgi:DMSO/TMAO reductase YedYZ heme-binding membrane subunit